MKQLVFSLIATLFIGVVSISAQSIKPKGFSRVSELSFGKISSYAGPCVDGAGTCTGTVVDDNATFQAGISKVSENVVSYAFSKDFYQNNIQYLKNGLYIGVPFSLPKSVTDKIGVSGEFVVARGTYSVTLSDGFYFVSLQREK